MQWHAGVEESGVDSIAHQVIPHDYWPELRFLILVVCDTKKKVASTAGQQQSLATSKIMLHRPQITKERIDEDAVFYRTYPLLYQKLGIW